MTEHPHLVDELDTAAAASSSATGPCGGAAFLSRVSISVPGLRAPGQIRDLFARVVAANPEYLPGVAAGEVSLGHWLARKDPSWSRVATTPATGDAPAAFIGGRLNGLRPDGQLLAGRWPWELGMLVVAPGVRGCGIGTAMVEHAVASFSTPLWSSVHQDGPGHRLLARAGWSETETFYWPHDPHPGVIMVSTT